MANFSQAYYSICSNVKQRVTADWFFVVEDSLCHVSLRDILPTAFFPTKFRAKDNLLANVIACIIVGEHQAYCSMYMKISESYTLISTNIKQF